MIHHGLGRFHITISHITIIQADHTPFSETVMLAANAIFSRSALRTRRRDGCYGGFNRTVAGVEGRVEDSARFWIAAGSRAPRRFRADESHQWFAYVRCVRKRYRRCALPL